jgi:cytochrome P450
MSERVNLMQPMVWTNPYAIYANLRRKSPVCEVEPGGVWAVARCSDVQFVLKNPELFSSASVQRIRRPTWIDGNPLASSIVGMDAPEHGKSRGLVSRALDSHVKSQRSPRACWRGRVFRGKAQPRSAASLTFDGASAGFP